jgi:hypothetical protein
VITKLTRRLAFVFSIVVACASCGSGGEVAGQLLAQGGIGGSGIVFGPVSTITSSSIVVNDVTWDISAAEITIDGKLVSNPGPQDQGQSKLGIFALGPSDPKLAPAKDRLEEGMVVTVEGTIDGDTGIATAVAAEHVINGAVQEIIDAYSVKVQGQIVQVDAATLLPDILDLSALTPNEHVRVSGLVKGNGVIAATRMERAGGVLGKFRVEGFIENTNLPAQTFNIGSHIVEYGQADISGLDGDPADGLLVEVTERNPKVIGTFSLPEINLEGLGLADVDRVKLEGFVSQVIPSNVFVLGNQPAQTDTSTLFAGGLANDIVAGMKLETEGVLVSGVLIVTKVSFSDPIVLESNLDLIDPANNTVTLMQLPGVTVTMNSLTTFVGVGSIDELTPNNHVQIRGHLNGDSALIATEITSAQPSTDVVLQGPINQAVDPIVTILGIPIDTSGFLDDQFKSLNDLPIGRAAFFDPDAAGTPGRLVKAHGSANKTEIWNQVELED